MIKFFRKIKQNLLSEGKTGKYLKYAIGEIVLVVIGILIALQINNWNENRVTTNNQEKYLVLIKKETLNNINELKRVKNRVDSMLIAQKHLINTLDIKSVTLSEKYLDSLLQRAFGPQTKIKLENSVLSELKTTGELKNITNDKIRNKLVGLEPIVYYAQEQEERVINSNEKGREVIVDIGNMASIIISAGIDIPKSFNKEASNLSLLDNSKFKNILSVYLAETKVCINRLYPRLENHLNDLNAMLDKELDL